ncbi:hypothetical protein Gotur_016621 [Gossypium turneri]
MESKKTSLASSTPNISPSALDEDIIVASKPKAGTTWLKALVFTIVNRHSYTLSNTPLNSANPHQLISHFEIKFYKENPNPDLAKSHPQGILEHECGEAIEYMFMRYEELKEDPVAQTKRLAEFLGFPFSMEEEKTGVVNQIIDFCSFNNLKDLEVNKTGKMPRSIIPSNKLFFRSGKVGDYINHLSPTAVERLSNVLKEKLSESSLTFN